MLEFVVWGNQWFIGWFGFNNGARCLIGTIRRHLGWEIGVQVKWIVEKPLTCRQTKNTMSVYGPEPVSRSCEEKAQSEIMKIERACLPYVPAKILLWVLFLLGLCSRLTFSIKLPGRLHCLWAHYRDTLCFVLQWVLFLFKETWQMEAKPLKSPFSGLNWTSPDRPISCCHCIEWIRPPRFIWENHVTQVNIVLLSL